MDFIIFWIFEIFFKFFSIKKITQKPELFSLEENLLTLIGLGLSARVMPAELAIAIEWTKFPRQTISSTQFFAFRWTSLKLQKKNDQKTPLVPLFSICSPSRNPDEFALWVRALLMQRKWASNTSNKNRQQKRQSSSSLLCVMN